MRYLNWYFSICLYLFCCLFFKEYINPLSEENGQYTNNNSMGLSRYSHYSGSICISKVLQFKKVCIPFFFIPKRIITFHRTIRIDINSFRNIFSRDEDSKTFLTAIVGCNSMMNDYISRSTLTKKNPNRWINRNCKTQEIVYGCSDLFLTPFLQHCIWTVLVHPSWDLVHTSWQFSTYESSFHLNGDLIPIR